MTTRKLGGLAALALAALAFGGCATPGPLHVYSLASATAAEIRDDGPAPATSVASFLAPGETVTGFAYDPFTDHFFLRLAPGNRIRVVDRPARAVKREFTVAQLPANGGGNIAVRPRDGHLFFVLPGEAAVLESTRFGEFVRQTPLAHRASAVAFDAARDQLWVLEPGAATVERLTADGKSLATIRLTQPVAPGSLAYDSNRRELYARLAAGMALGVFDENGRLLHTLGFTAEFFDVGPRSFLRMF